MIISEREAIDLRKLVDSDHQADIQHPAGLGSPYTLTETPEHRWAIEQVWDWRIQRRQVAQVAA